jgi:glucose-1-phosphate thymidylyltransferase
MSKNNTPESIIEKPNIFVSNFAVPGLYFYDSDLTLYLHQINQSKRGEYEISTLNNLLLENKKVQIEILQRGTVWIDAGTPDRLKMASDYVFTIQERLGYSIGNIHEIAYKNGWITESSLKNLFKDSLNDNYSKYILSLLEQ